VKCTNSTSLLCFISTSRDGKLDSKLSETQQSWLDSSEQENDDDLENTLTLSPSLYASNDQESIRLQTSNEGDQYIAIKGTVQMSTTINFEYFYISASAVINYYIRAI
jgi:hypothetical protein